MSSRRKDSRIRESICRMMFALYHLSLALYDEIVFVQRRCATRYVFNTRMKYITQQYSIYIIMCSERPPTLVIVRDNVVVVERNEFRLSQDLVVKIIDAANENFHNTESDGRRPHTGSLPLHQMARRAVSSMILLCTLCAINSNQPD